MIIEKHEDTMLESDDVSAKSAQARAASVPERELPPPYAEGSRPPGAPSAPPPTSSRENSVFQPTLQQHVNGVSLFSKRSTISAAGPHGVAGAQTKEVWHDAEQRHAQRVVRDAAQRDIAQPRDCGGNPSA
ncbi:hypothetical protein NM688_g131 [Phlebia brevispora]|uniref:Uncharacterized protein n=1 Tax=Phlebia brevispora TaxID=194682 RepID=A0ACC1TF75_9APHY|nr:hypothetical protein NM688_g131 [Phlebia brevispora]